jgi:tyrosyl-tRNA synthetase
MPSDPLAPLLRGAVACTTEAELKARLARGKPLRVKLGVDPTAPDLHLGFTVPLRKLRQFQDAGHVAVLMIGDYTARVGDPSGKNSTRPMLGDEEIQRNLKTYLEQAGKVLKPGYETVFNGSWFSTMSFTDVLKLASKMTVARMLERDDFSKRFKDGTPISLHEMLYPLMQGHDSVRVKADVELGGTDQTFNLLVGRDLQREEGQEPQVCITLPLLEGLDGVRKMSKSYGNYVGLNEPPKDMFGKLMSLPDTLMGKYYTLLTDLEMPSGHPRDAKVGLAKEILRMYHGKEAAEAAAGEFERIFSKKELPDEMPEVKLLPGLLQDGRIWIVKLVQVSNLVASGGEARRQVAQGAVSLDGAVVSDPEAKVTLKDGAVLKVGKRRFARIRL